MFNECPPTAFAAVGGDFGTAPPTFGSTLKPSMTAPLYSTLRALDMGGGGGGRSSGRSCSPYLCEMPKYYLSKMLLPGPSHTQVPETLDIASGRGDNAERSAGVAEKRRASRIPKNQRIAQHKSSCISENDRKRFEMKDNASLHMKKRIED